jgi:serine/threonine protein kinase
MTEEASAFRKYRLIAEIGRGGMADVFLAVVQGPAGFNKLVVIKKARAELAQDPDFLAMFLDEARLAARLSHPNVVQTHEVGQEDDRYFIAMEYLDGQPLNRVRARLGAAFRVAMQVRVLADVLAGLHHAHELADFDGTPLGVVHRDATPQNVFVTYDGVVKVVDFGIAKAVDSSAETRTGVVKGKVTYMAPEQARGDKVDRRTDIFAVGVMLWEGIVGRRMWKGTPDIAVVHALVHGTVPPLREAAPDVSPELAAIVERALSPNREDRWSTALELEKVLLAWLAASGDNPTARDVGHFVAEKFADDRSKVKSLIESQLRDVRWSGAYPRISSLDLPKIDPSQVLITPTGKQRMTPTPSGETSIAGAPAVPSSSSLTGVGTQVSAAQPAPQGRPLKLLVVGAVAAAAVIVLGVRFLLPSGPPAPASTATATTTAPSSAPAAPQVAAPAPGQAAVKLTIRVTPADAKIYLDDVLLSAGPFEDKVMKSDKVRKLRAEAPHYVSKEETVTLTSDMMLDLSLEREAGAPAVAPAAGPLPVGAGPRPRVDPQPAPQPVQAPASPAPPPTGQKPKRAIDSDSPYAK